MCQNTFWCANAFIVACLCLSICCKIYPLDMLKAYFGAPKYILIDRPAKMHKYRVHFISDDPTTEYVILLHLKHMFNIFMSFYDENKLC